MATLRSSFAKKRVWRTSGDAPLGEGVDSTPIAAPTPETERPEVRADTWVSSSFDLLHGTDVSENPDTVPGEWLDELLQPNEDPPKTPGK